MKELTERFVPVAYSNGMADKNHPTSFDVQGDPKPDLRTDYALIATGFGAALLALAYLLLT